MERRDVDVLVIGAGPTGATAALALATYGVDVMVVTKYRWLSNSPRAHITNQRTMEVFRDLEVADEIARYGSPWESMGDTVFARSLTGEEIARIRTWGTGDDRHGDYVRASPEPMRDVPQPQLEGVLVKEAAARGAHVVFNTEYVEHWEDPDGVTVLLRDRRTGDERHIRARYLIGADGARSKVLERAGLKVEGELGRASTAYVEFEADLTRLVEHRPSILYWILSPSASYGEIGMGLLRSVRAWDRWIAGWGYDPADGEPDFSTLAVTERIRTLVGEPDLDPRIVATSTWQVNQASAPQYSTTRVFCGGDAVHRHPPSNGLGSNTSVQDAYNLAWKLAYAIQGYADPALLQTYSLERAPVGAQVIARANLSRREFQAVLKAVGAGTGTETHPLDDPGPEGVAARAELAAAVEGKNAEFNAHGVEMNQRYESSAVIPDGHIAEPFLRDPELFAQATTMPGAKLPHAWLVGADGRRKSTLDLVGRGRFTLLTGRGGENWRLAVASMGVPWLRFVAIGDPDARDLYFDWARTSRLGETDAVLVRPDGYIAWLCREWPLDAAAAASRLGVALTRILSGGSSVPSAVSVRA